ncbi:MAG: NAD-dependent epimerase/dehydratase family protein [Acholeplasmatales bacterium]|nr:NAD-dependent epimerase/dehydratase family protein [Acholeplasmatales bacterium]
MEELYIVTGAAGFLGSTIVRQLVEKNKRVRAFVLPNDKSVEYLPSNIEIVKGDLLDIDSLENLFKDSNKYITYVMHIASIVTVDPEYSQLVMDVNVKGTKNIIDMSIKYNIKRLLYCSSTGAIPELKKGKISETESFDENKVLGCYSKSKALATKLVLSYKDLLDVVVVHPSGILGPNDYAKGETTRVLIDIINGKMKAGINGSFNLCDVRDLANGAILALKNGRRGECYILANDMVSFKKFAKMISKEAKNNKKVKLFLPIWLSNIIAKKMEKKAKKNGTKPLMTTFSVYNLARNNDFSSEKAKKELGYETRSYEITIKDEVKWLKERGLIHA